MGSKEDEIIETALRNYAKKRTKQMYPHPLGPAQAGEVERRIQELKKKYNIKYSKEDKDIWLEHKKHPLVLSRTLPLYGIKIQ